MADGIQQPLFPEHFDGKRFFNPGAPQARGLGGFLKWMFTRKREASPRFIADVKPTKPPAQVEANEWRVTLVNHSTVLLQLGGLHVLTDPLWSKRAGPFGWTGPQRRREPGVRWEDLPRIDLVLISHNHYDHLDLATLRKFASRGQTQFIAPLGVGKLLRSEKIGAVTELDWGQSSQFGSCTVHSVPANHFSARGPFDRNQTLWCGYVIDVGGRMLYFAADTGFGKHFAQIREQFGAPRLALLPIGAYEPRWFMSPIHMAPDEAVMAHQILGAQNSIAIHHGTFQLADEGIDRPKQELRACAPGDSFLVLDNGQSVTLAA
jgi:L-ascorbate metabolism protein UlaG (beta-lactamase superfamily)